MARGPLSGTARPRSMWTPSEDAKLRAMVKAAGDKVPRWSEIAKSLPGRNRKDVRKRWSYCLNPTLTKGAWSRPEDSRLRAAVQDLGADDWVNVAHRVGSRTGDQCAKRWRDVLDPTIAHERWTARDDARLVELTRELGHNWSQIATHFPGRRGVQCRNRAHSLSKRLNGLGNQGEGGSSSTGTTSRTAMTGASSSKSAASTSSSSKSRSRNAASSSVAVASLSGEQPALGSPYGRTEPLIPTMSMAASLPSDQRRPSTAVLPSVPTASQAMRCPSWSYSADEDEDDSPSSPMKVATSSSGNLQQDAASSAQVLTTPMMMQHRPQIKAESMTAPSSLGRYPPFLSGANGQFPSSFTAAPASSFFPLANGASSRIGTDSMPSHSASLQWFAPDGQLPLATPPRSMSESCISLPPPISVLPWDHERQRLDGKAELQLPYGMAAYGANQIRAASSGDSMGLTAVMNHAEPRMSSSATPGFSRASVPTTTWSIGSGGTVSGQTFGRGSMTEAGGGGAPGTTGLPFVTNTGTYLPTSGPPTGGYLASTDFNQYRDVPTSPAPSIATMTTVSPQGPCTPGMFSSSSTMQSLSQPSSPATLLSFSNNHGGNGYAGVGQPYSQSWGYGSTCADVGSTSSGSGGGNAGGASAHHSNAAFVPCYLPYQSFYHSRPMTAMSDQSFVSTEVLLSPSTPTVFKFEDSIQGQGRTQCQGTGEDPYRPSSSASHPLFQPQPYSQMSADAQSYHSLPYAQQQQQQQQPDCRLRLPPPSSSSIAPPHSYGDSYPPPQQLTNSATAMVVAAAASSSPFHYEPESMPAANSGALAAASPPPPGMPTGYAPPPFEIRPSPSMAL